MLTNRISVAGCEISSEMAERMILVPGNTARLQRVFARAGAGKSLVIGYIGGSITIGAAASTGFQRYTAHVTRWFQAGAAESVLEINAGCGGTGTDFAAYRIQEDLLVREPDIVFVEFSVNDRPDEAATFSMEAVVRQILAMPNEPAVVMVAMLRSEGGNAQAAHAPVARHYEIPFLSIRDALWPEIESGRLAWDDLFADAVHPNDRGHALTAGLIQKFLELVQNMSWDVLPAGDYRLPDPLKADSADFQRTVIVRGDAGDEGPIRLLESSGWNLLCHSRHGPAWESSRPGSEIVFAFEGTRVALLVHRSGSGMGMLEASVDGGPVRSFDTHTLEKLQNNSAVFPVESSLPAGRHTIVIRHSHLKNPESPGNHVELRMVMVAGGSR